MQVSCIKTLPDGAPPGMQERVRFWGGIGFYLIYSVRRRDEVYQQPFLGRNRHHELVELGWHYDAFQYREP